MAWIIVNGTVENTFWEGKGARIKESFPKRDGTEGSRYYSAFFDEPHGLQVGDAGKFQGLHGAKPAQDPKFVDISINSTRVDDLVQGEGAFEDDEAPF